MDITTISKPDFEESMPVGMSSHEEIYESVKPALDEMLSSVRSSILGDEGETMLQGADPESILARNFKKVVSISAFLSVLRQLDLVLTPSGFGVVSNDNIAPASQSRVDALEASLRTEGIKAKAQLLYNLRSDKWGKTSQAARQIPFLYDEYYFFLEGRSSNLQEKDWNAFNPTIQRVDEYIRSLISDNQMDAMLTSFRCNDQTLPAYGNAISEIRRITDMVAADKHEILKTTCRRLLQILNSDPDNFSEYFSSLEYKANNHETYKNTPDKTAFVFG